MGTTEPAAAVVTVEEEVEGLNVALAEVVEVGEEEDVEVVVEIIVEEDLSEDAPGEEEEVGGLAVGVVGFVVVVDTVVMLSAKALAICAATRAQS